MKTLHLSILSSVLLSSTLFGATLSPNNTQSSLIIYNSNIGLVHEQRDLHLKKDETKIIYEDVASSINTDSINISLPDSITLFSQQYRYDKLTQKKLLDAHIAKEVQVRVEDDTKIYKTLNGILLSNNGSKSIIKTNDNIITVKSDNIIFKSIPNELITKPSLVWNIKNKKEVDSKISLDYIINRITWKSDYVLNIKQNKANLSGWITINNNSGKSFKETSLHVLAGEINRANKPKKLYKIVRTMAVMDSAPTASHKAYQGYHLYTVPFSVTLANNEKTQLKFISQNDIHIERNYSSTLSNPNHLNGEINHAVLQYIKLDKLKYPLPKGVVRSYSKLKDTNILLGESKIAHTPKETPISLKIGKNFDVKVKETLLNRNDEHWSLNVDVKYSVKNSSDELKIIKLIIPFNKNEGSKVKSKEKFTYTKGNLVTFEIKVEPLSTKTFNVHFKTKK
jgi:hypothetical protein